MNSPRPDSPARLTRREFVAGALVSSSLVGGGLRATAAESPLNTDPGFVGPAYFDDAERRALLEVCETASPFRYWGPGQPRKVQRFEEAFAQYMGTKFALGVTSGTAALDCAMAALGIGPGDEVIVPAYTWWSDYTCVIHSAALPVFAEMDRSLTLDPEDLARKITPRTKAVIAVHLLGGPCDMDPILAIARERNLAVVEDCAQCVGGSYKGRKLGSLGDIGIYSFQINKTITSGEGGALVTNDARLYERAVRFHDMGGYRPLFEQRTGGAREPVFAGENFRMSELTGAVLGAQLPKLDRMVADLRRHAGAIYAGIRDLPGIRLRQQPDPAGDIGYSAFFEVRDKTTRDRCLTELRRRSVPASTLVGSVLLPVEEAVMAKRARHPAWPSFQTAEGRTIQYGPAACPQTLEIFDRFVQIRVGPKFTERVDQYLVENIRQVWATLG
ncbi:MAG: DegT/DnrJ/EryC1/StrS family aminotransferase [Verrucomicrobia bacterium]|nr:DegT/DnrJ/EryC1/StrS family aminotransferase [Verrucomicrobiota bacterium]